MADALELEVATPERELVKERVSEVELRGKSGYMEILPGHAPLLGELGIGNLTYVAGHRRWYLAVHSGFVEILDDHVLRPGRQRRAQQTTQRLLPDQVR